MPVVTQSQTFWPYLGPFSGRSKVHGTVIYIQRARAGDSRKFPRKMCRQVQVIVWAVYKPIEMVMSRKWGGGKK